MSAKNQKLARKILSHLPKLDKISDVARKECGENEQIYQRWAFQACKVLHENPSFPIDDLIPSKMFLRLVSEFRDYLQSEA